MQELLPTPPEVLSFFGNPHKHRRGGRSFISVQGHASSLTPVHRDSLSSPYLFPSWITIQLCIKGSAHRSLLPNKDMQLSCIPVPVYVTNHASKGVWKRGLWEKRQPTLLLLGRITPRHMLTQGSSLFWKEVDNKYLEVCGAYGFCHNCSTPDDT